MAANDTQATMVDAGERARFEALALPHLRRLYRLAVRLTGRETDAEDVVHETYVKGLRAFATLRDPERIGPWLSRILTRLILDIRRDPVTRSRWETSTS